MRVSSVIKLLTFISSIALGCSVPAPLLSPEQAAQREQKIRSLMAQGVDGLRLRSAIGADVAEAAFNIALALDPTDARVLDGLGCVAYFRRDFELAKSYFQKAVVQNRRYDRPVLHLAEIARLRGESVAALELYHVALRLNPLNYRSRNNYAVFLAHELGGVEQRVEYQQLLEAAVLAGPDEVKINDNLREVVSTELREIEHPGPE